ncbi:MAG: type IV pilin protein [Candidatus Nanosyncoccaceae bacterium]|jgi:prepilin-type N-terminal cleavage/methylation domain-containing protein
MSKKLTKKGFTIVELLIVIVVMGILATIVIVTYQGVQDKANTTKNQSNAKEVIAKAEAYNSLETGYPLTVSELTGYDDSSVKLSAEVVEVLQNGAISDDPTGDSRKNIHYSLCPAGATADPTGIRVQYWDYDKKELKDITSGDCS